ncbi:MAG: DUF2971 domain-containing protein [Pseudomonadota bacterium]
MEPISFYDYFKFKPINKYLIESLVNQSLYFPKPAQLNDPFDCNLSILKLLKYAACTAEDENKSRLLAVSQDEALLENLEEKIRDLGVCSFSLLKKFDKPLQWAHYADNHKGVCLLYRFPTTFLNNPNEIIGVDKVEYGQNRLYSRLSDWVSFPPTPQVNNQFLIDFAKIYLTTKSIAWKIEEEARIIRPTSGPFAIPQILKQVVFGIKTPESDIRLIKMLAEKHSGCTKFYKMIPAHNKAFGITTEKV